MSLILSGTDGLSDVDGSAATPAIRGTDANTGMFFPAADTIAFSEGGVESMRLNSSGVLVTTNDASISGLTVGKGGGAVASNTAVGLAMNATATGGGNAAFGYGALYVNTTGSENTAVGDAPLRFNTTGANNTAIGSNALNSNTTASNNTAVGYQSGYTNTTGLSSTYLGYQAGYTSNANGNVFVGSVAGKLATGSANTFMGYESGYNSTGSNNSFYGYDSGLSNTSGGSNVAMGREALFSNTTASNNTAVGYKALYTSTTAAGNTALGQQAGLSATTGYENVFLGANAGNTVTTGNRNTIVGNVAGSSLTTGSNNTFVGANGTAGGCGEAVTTGSKNTILGGYTGNQGGLDIRTASNYIVLSDGDGNPRLYMNGSGIVYSVPTYNNATGNAANMFVGSDGTFNRSTSSLKYKRDVENVTHGLAEVLQLRPVTYKGKSESDGDKVFGGLIAEEVDALGLTEFVQYADDGTPDALAYGNMVSLCIKAIQELNAKVEAQALEIATLKGN
jgi:hypothetical protein